MENRNLSTKSPHFSLSSSIPTYEGHKDSGLEHKAVPVKHIYGVLVTGVPKKSSPKAPEDKKGQEAKEQNSA